MRTVLDPGNAIETSWLQSLFASGPTPAQLQAIPERNREMAEFKGRVAATDRSNAIIEFTWDDTIQAAKALNGATAGNGSFRPY